MDLWAANCSKRGRSKYPTFQLPWPTCPALETSNSVLGRWARLFPPIRYHVHLIIPSIHPTMPRIICHIYPYIVHMDVFENSGTPKSSILIGFSIIFTIHFGGKNPIFGNIHILGPHSTIQKNTPPKPSTLPPLPPETTLPPALPPAIPHLQIGTWAPVTSKTSCSCTSCIHDTTWCITWVELVILPMSVGLFSGVIILPPKQFTFIRGFPENYHRFALFVPQKIGNLMTPGFCGCFFLGKHKWPWGRNTKQNVFNRISIEFPMDMISTLNLCVNSNIADPIKLGTPWRKDTVSA